MFKEFDGSTLNFKREENAALAALRRESLDIYSRLQSIEEDISFVEQVRQTYPNLPFLPNLRCGAWYTDPEKTTAEPAYFKSTDGHYGHWRFNLRRPNFNLLQLVVDRGGMLLVDSTRAGKRLPDALSKTVPIWCAVVNRAVAHVYNKSEGWDTKLYTAPGAVSTQEHQSIALHLDTWAQSLATSAYELPELQRPLRPLWITPATSAFPILDVKDALEFHPVVCISASKQIADGLERRSHGFTYIQGSADDHELWGMGLTPELFWKNKASVLSASRAELPGLVATLTSTQKTMHAVGWTAAPTPITRVSGTLLISRISDLPDTLPYPLPQEDFSADEAAYIVLNSASEDVTRTAGDATSGPSRVMRINTPQGKRGNMHFLQCVLPQSLPFIERHLRQGARICIACEDGADTSVGVAVAALQHFFDDQGNLDLDHKRIPADKQSIRMRLQWIICSRPLANPSRATLKRVNEFRASSMCSGRYAHALHIRVNDNLESCLHPGTPGRRNQQVGPGR